jgi:hypothetical protein
MSELYAVRLFRKVREVRAPALVPVRRLVPKSVGHRQECDRQFRFEPSLIQRPSEKKIPSIQLDICDGSSTSDNGTVPLSPMMRALTSA